MRNSNRLTALRVTRLNRPGRYADGLYLQLSQWRSTLATYAYPVFGKLPVAEIDTGLMLQALEPIWNDKHETAQRVRGRIKAILDWAKVRGYRSGDNPATWSGHLDHLLAR